VQFHAPHADADGEAANGATVDAGQARSGADAFAKGGNDFNLLFAGKNIRIDEVKVDLPQLRSPPFMPYCAWPEVSHDRPKQVVSLTWNVGQYVQRLAEAQTATE
jgi:hypothetical protein